MNGLKINVELFYGYFRFGIPWDRQVFFGMKSACFLWCVPRNSHRLFVGSWWRNSWTTVLLPVVSANLVPRLTNRITNTTALRWKWTAVTPAHTAMTCFRLLETTGVGISESWVHFTWVNITYWSSSFQNDGFVSYCKKKQQQKNFFLKMC